VHKAYASLWFIGSFGWLAAADAQTSPASNTSTRFDGTYAFVSWTKVNETYTTTATNHVGQCPDLRGGPLKVVNGEIRLGSRFAGTVGSQGEFVMRLDATPYRDSPGVEATVTGRPQRYGKCTAQGLLL
jgi:hypothetical protein